MVNQAVKIISGACLAGLLFLAGAGCGADPDKRDKEQDGGEPPVAGQAEGRAVGVELPMTSPIDLASLVEDDGASLTAESVTGRNCGRFGRYGVFGLPLGLACEMGPMVGDLLYGSKPDRDGDGRQTCSDDVEGDDGGFLTGLLCSRDLQYVNRVQSVGFTGEDGRQMAVGFGDFDRTDDVDAIGSWSAALGDRGVYPANIRAWIEPNQGAGLAPVIGLSLTDGRHGRLYVDGTPVKMAFRGDVRFGAQADPSRCMTTPGKDTCHWQEIRINGVGDAASADVMPGVHLVIMADAKEPTFAVIEGEIALNEAAAAKWFGDADVPGEFKKTRSIYFRVIARRTGAWGSFQFRDAAGSTFKAPGADGMDLVALLKDGFSRESDAGICIDGPTGTLKACAGGEAARYAPLFLGAAALTAPAANAELPLAFGAAPAAGVVLAP